MTVEKSYDPEIESAQMIGPHPRAVGLFAGIVIAPFAWALQILICYGLAAYACYPTDVALGMPLWGHLRPILAGTSAALWALLLLGCGIAWRNWKLTHSHERVDANADADADADAIQSGTGRRKFMALCGVLVSGMFAVVLLFTSVSIAWVPSCGP